MIYIFNNIIINKIDKMINQIKLKVYQIFI